MSQDDELLRACHLSGQMSPAQSVGTFGAPAPQATDLELWRRLCAAFVSGARFAGADMSDRLLNVRVNDAAEVYADKVDSGWMPIETAVKQDRKPLLLWVVHHNARYSKDSVAEGWEAPCVACWLDFNGGGWCWHGPMGTATHWMPLPSAPTAMRATMPGDEGCRA